MSKLFQMITLFLYVTLREYNRDMPRDNSYDKQFLRTITMTEDEECVLGEMVAYFNDMGWINDDTEEAYDSLVEKYCEPSPFDYEPIEVTK